MSTITLSQLPQPDVIEVLDFETILAERKAYFVSLYPADQQAAIAATLALESEPITKLLQENAYRELILRQRINDAAVANMLAWAKGSDLDNLVANWKVQRLIIQPGDDTANPPVPEIKEDDEALILRALMAWDGLSVAGPTGAYEYFALSADGRVADAKGSSPAPAEALVTILSTEGDGTADATLIANVTQALSHEDTRPVADRLSVQSASIIHYTITAQLHISSQGAEADVILQAARDQLAAFINPRRRIGVEVPRSAIDAALHVQGVRKVDLIGWADIAPSPTQAAYCTGFTVERAP
ncbi:baseplate J/gp47 family protein [Aeromonas rivipollensis]|uniref:baseplate J/gp47 family protein n=1 Tax=Aeromonas rivipollensis TaxID=948519 RepID=UPI00259D85DC|nr:baseplate J/gp47 family protein [Aeromonas rivipollensis]MDM5086290.1 baseplate J/gp47 family protein [Aeromonas rivipollensis]MDM5098809.1 baseplate J/gp47 family protein [Aeromonas rivipollensis]MDM5107228.1 baseplate J/gp47 family protein [Aeromonas rivipollensis]